MTTDPEEPGASPAADRLLEVLQFLAAQRGPVPAAVVSRELALPRSTVYQLLRSLRRRGFAAHFPEARRYGLGLSAFELSSAYLRQAPLGRLGAPLLAALADQVGQSAHLAVLHGRDVIYLVEERAPHRPTLVTDVGVRLPAHLTATGRSMLAELSAPQLRALYAAPAAFETRTGVGPRRYRELREVLAQVRAAGYGFEDGEVTEGIASVAVSFTDRSGWPRAAIGVSLPAVSLESAAAATLADRLRPYAEELARRLGAR
ncbi:MAG: IclR family transcriptional regulator [Trebonia sp.]